MGFADTAARELLQGGGDALGFADTAARKLLHGGGDALGFVDTAARKLLHGGGDAVGFADTAARKLLHGGGDALGFADKAARKLLHGGGDAIAQGVAAGRAVGMSFDLNGLWQLIGGLFANLLAALGGAAHVLVLPFEALWNWLQTAVADAGAVFEKLWEWLQTAIPVVLVLASILCLVAVVYFCWPFLFAAAVWVGQALVYVVCFCGRCLYPVAVGVGQALACVLPSCARCCVCVTMNAPGAAGMVISRVAFVADPRLYFQILRSAGGLVASAVFCTAPIASAVAASVAALFRA